MTDGGYTDSMSIAPQGESSFLKRHFGNFSDEKVQKRIVVFGFAATFGLSALLALFVWVAYRHLDRFF